jgi:hypothetical protein
LRKARELAYRDLGGLVFNLHRFAQRNDALVMAKLTTLAHIDGELRTLEATLGDGLPVTVLREAGITACARCAAIHSSEDRFCPNCGLALARRADLPIAGPATPALADASSAPTPQASAPPQSAAVPPPPPPARAAPAPARANPAGQASGESAAPAPASPLPPTHAPAAAFPSSREPDAASQEEATEITRPPAASQ